MPGAFQPFNKSIPNMPGKGIPAGMGVNNKNPHDASILTQGLLNASQPETGIFLYVSAACQRAKQQPAGGHDSAL
jgi:hypothetical protein